MSGRVYLLGVGGALVALALVFTDWEVSPQPGVTEANCARLRKGMTSRQVEMILGGPGADGQSPSDPFPPPREAPRPRFWRGTHGEATVFFTEADTIGEVYWSEGSWTRTPQPPPSPFARLCAWLGW